jgi:hypothetical protein
LIQWRGWSGSAGFLETSSDSTPAIYACMRTGGQAQPHSHSPPKPDYTTKHERVHARVRTHARTHTYTHRLTITDRQTDRQTHSHACRRASPATITRTASHNTAPHPTAPRCTSSHHTMPLHPCQATQDHRTPHHERACRRAPPTRTPHTIKQQSHVAGANQQTTRRPLTIYGCVQAFGEGIHPCFGLTGRNTKALKPHLNRQTSI